MLSSAPRPRPAIRAASCSRETVATGVWRRRDCSCSTQAEQPDEPALVMTEYQTWTPPKKWRTLNHGQKNPITLYTNFRKKKPFFLTSKFKPGCVTSRVVIDVWHKAYWSRLRGGGSVRLTRQSSWGRSCRSGVSTSRRQRFLPNVLHEFWVLCPRGTWTNCGLV